MSCLCGRTPDPGICPITHDGHPAGGHCACLHTPDDRASVHQAAVNQIRVIAHGLYFETGARVLSALNDEEAQS